MFNRADWHKPFDSDCWNLSWQITRRCWVENLAHILTPLISPIYHTNWGMICSITVSWVSMANCRDSVVPTSHAPIIFTRDNTRLVSTPWSNIGRWIIGHWWWNNVKYDSKYILEVGSGWPSISKSVPLEETSGSFWIRIASQSICPLALGATGIDEAAECWMGSSRTILADSEHFSLNCGRKPEARALLGFGLLYDEVNCCSVAGRDCLIELRELVCLWRLLDDSLIGVTSPFSGYMQSIPLLRHIEHFSSPSHLVFPTRHVMQALLAFLDGVGFKASPWRTKCRWRLSLSPNHGQRRYFNTHE